MAQILWPFGDVDPHHPAFEAINLLAVRQAIPLTPGEVDLRPDEAAGAAWRAEVVARSLARKIADTPPQPPDGELTRAEFLQRWWQRIKDLPERPFSRQLADDADADGIVDGDDPLPFVAGRSTWGERAIPAEADGLPDPLNVGARTVRQFNFTGPGSADVEGFVNDTGRPFNNERGFGWMRDLSASNRRRNRIDGDQRDTFLFTRGHDTWECAVAEGSYRVTVCIGDSAHPQPAQNVTVEGRPLFRDRATEAGTFAEGMIEVDVRDGRLTIEIGGPGATANTCLNWVRIGGGTL